MNEQLTAKSKVLLNKKWLYGYEAKQLAEELIGGEISELDFSLLIFEKRCPFYLDEMYQNIYNFKPIYSEEFPIPENPTDPNFKILKVNYNECWAFPETNFIWSTEPLGSDKGDVSTIRLHLPALFDSEVYLDHEGKELWQLNVSNRYQGKKINDLLKDGKVSHPLVVFKSTDIKTLADKINSFELSTNQAESVRNSDQQLRVQPKKNTPKYQQQKELILNTIKSLGYEPTNLPLTRGIAGAKSKVKAKLLREYGGLFYSVDAFDSAWKKAREEGLIGDKR